MSEFKPVLILLGKFFLVYIILTILYSLYLNHYLEELSTADPFTSMVSKSSAACLQVLGYESNTVHVGDESYMRFYLDNVYSSIVNEGCNAISVMIIFTSFIVAFSNGLKRTLIFVIAGLVFLHVINIIRVSWLNYIFVYNQDWGKAAHDYVFPAIIYGCVVFLWLIWVKFFMKKTPQ